MYVLEGDSLVEVRSGGSFSGLLSDSENLYVAGHLDGFSLLRWDGNIWRGIASEEEIWDITSMAFHGDELFVSGNTKTINGKPALNYASWSRKTGIRIVSRPTTNKGLGKVDRVIFLSQGSALHSGLFGSSFTGVNGRVSTNPSSGNWFFYPITGSK